jgi:hypothetical protein
MFDVVNFTAGLFIGGFLGALAATMVKAIHINQLETDIMVFDKLLYDAQKKLRRLTERDSKGRFTGGK